MFKRGLHFAFEKIFGRGSIFKVEWIHWNPDWSDADHAERAPSQWTSAKRAKINTRLNGQYRSTFICSIALCVSSVNDQALPRLDCSRFYLLFCCVAVHTSITYILDIFKRRLCTYVFIALLAFKEIHQFVCSCHYFFNSVTWPTFRQHHDVVRVARIKYILSSESSANHSLYFSGTTAANHAKLLIGRATKNIISR